MHDRGVFLVPTLTTRVGLMQSKLPPLVREKAARTVAQQDAMVRRALELGVRIALGTDAGVYAHGQNATEFALMVAAGMAPAQALKAGTSVAAELLGLQNKVGVLKAGMLADICGPRQPADRHKGRQQRNFRDEGRNGVPERRALGGNLGLPGRRCVDGRLVVAMVQLPLDVGPNSFRTLENVSVAHWIRSFWRLSFQSRVSG